MNINKKAILLLALSCCLDLCAQNNRNPVLPGVADAGAVKYNGKYYIGGVFTNGDFYISKDLVNWGIPVHVVSMDNDWTKGSGAEIIRSMQTICLFERGFSFILVCQLLGERQTCRTYCTCTG